MKGKRDDRKKREEPELEPERKKNVDAQAEPRREKGACKMKR